ncbi:MAG TPA: ComF family protein [Pyrinomonadaceae bacterium]|nr:ComF family protein [Pyrinomonadaceae bacterium]
MFQDALLTLAYPQVCAMCGRSVEQRRFGVVCEACWGATLIFNGEETLCLKCGAPDLRAEPACQRCDAHSFTAARAAGLYEGALRETVLQLKRRPYLPNHVEMILVSAAQRDPLHESTRIVPVPLHTERLRARGFNQASIIAQMLAKSLLLPLDEVSLVRVSGSEKHRAGLDAKGRHDTVAGAFVVPHRALVANENVLLVDDVFTTGATVSACAEALISAGAAKVLVLTLARATPPINTRNSPVNRNSF